MISYTTRYVNIVSILITIVIYFFLIKSNYLINQININSYFISNIFKKDSILVELRSNNINQETKENLENQNNYPLIELNKNLESKEEDNWKIKIPKIALEANISEGTRKEVMDKYIGHFEETSKTNGNIGLAAHNRGYEVNYFSKLKNLRNGDELIYKYYDFEKTYIVVQNKIIKDTDWEDLEETEKNIITLITCIENQPEYRRCIQGIEK